MKTQIMLLLAVATALTIQGQVPSAITAVTPSQISYQGRLLKENGLPYDNAVHTFDIRLYRTDTGGTPLWGGQYTTYVKDGYFNLMLGGTQASTLLAGTTYNYTNLWKALWYDASVAEGQRNALYLGVTPRNNETGGTISSPTELMPRQVLQTAPFAFRSQTSEYANRSSENFTAGGILYAQGLAVPNLFMTGTDSGNQTATVGGPATQPFRSTVQGKRVLVLAGTDDLYLNSTDRIDMDAVGVMDLTAGTFQLDSSGSATVTASTDLKLNASTVKGKGAVEWAKISSSSTYYQPFLARRFALTSTFGSADPTLVDTGYSVTDYSAVVVGCTQIDNGSAPLTGAHTAPCLAMIPSGSTWSIRAQVSRTATLYYYVDVLFISKRFASDNR